MRLVVVSDSHGHWGNLFSAIENEPSAEVVYFLGDGYREYDDLTNAYSARKAFIGVIGNCDFQCPLPPIDIRTLNDTRIYATHGYIQHVKHGLCYLEKRAEEEKCNLVLFGHTHQPFTSYKNGIYYFNPGSIREGSYGIVDITEKGIMCINKKLVTY